MMTSGRSSLLVLGVWAGLSQACGSNGVAHQTSPNVAGSAGSGVAGVSVPTAGQGGALSGTGGTAGVGGGTGGVGAAAVGGSAGSGEAGSGEAGTAADGGSAGSGSAGTGSMPAACGGNLLSSPEDPGQRGGWDVGVRTIKIGRLTTEVLYPAQPGSTTGVAETTYDIRDWLPASQRDLVPPDHSPAVKPIGGHLYRDVPIDAAHGPYPLIVFIHGTASFRIASGSLNVLWASRGFVVIAADYPGLGLADQLAPGCNLPQSGSQDVMGDVNAQLAAVSGATGDLAFLKDRVDNTRVGISGHSQGGCLTATFSTLPNVQIVMPLDSSTSVSMSSTLKSILYVSGQSDTVIGYNGIALGNVVCPPNPLPATSDMDGYTQSPTPTGGSKRIVAIKGGGHLTPTDLCQKNMQGYNAIQEANMDGVCGINSAAIIGLPALFDCGVSGFDWQAGVAAVGYVTSAALEETLHCKDETAVFSGLATHDLIGDFKHTP